MATTDQGQGAGSSKHEITRGSGVSKARSMSPRLLRRLGEASMGTRRDFGEQWWICRYEPDPETRKYGIEGPFHTPEEAQNAVGDRQGFGVFGAYEPGEREGLASMVKPSAKVVAVHVFLEGVNDPIPVDVDTFDALFWSPAAIEKFVFPYYCGADGLDYTIRVRNEYVAKNAYLMAHSDDTEYTLYGGSRRDGVVPKLTLEPLSSSR